MGLRLGTPGDTGVGGGGRETCNTCKSGVGNFFLGGGREGNGVEGET